jgi:hypothetical protein
MSSQKLPRVAQRHVALNRAAAARAAAAHQPPRKAAELTTEVIEMVVAKAVQLADAESDDKAVMHLALSCQSFRQTVNRWRSRMGVSKSSRLRCTPGMMAQIRTMSRVRRFICKDPWWTQVQQMADALCNQAGASVEVLEFHRLSCVRVLANPLPFKQTVNTLVLRNCANLEHQSVGARTPMKSLLTGWKQVRCLEIDGATPPSADWNVTSPHLTSLIIRGGPPMHCNLVGDTTHLRDLTLLDNVSPTVVAGLRVQICDGS